MAGKIQNLPFFCKRVQKLAGARHVFVVQIGERVVQNEERLLVDKQRVAQRKAHADVQHVALPARKVRVAVALAVVHGGDGEVRVHVEAALVAPGDELRILSKPAAPLGAKRTLLVIGMGLTGYLFTVSLTAGWSLLWTYLTGGGASTALAETVLDEPLWLLLIVIALTPAICEELFFRGILMKSLAYDPAGAVCLSAALFALMHFDMTKLFPTFALGLFIGWVVLRTGNLKAGMLLHFINNAISVCYIKAAGALSSMDPDAITNALASDPALAVQTGVAGIAAMLLVVLGIPLFVLFLVLFLRDTKRDADRLREEAYALCEHHRGAAVFLISIAVAMFAAALLSSGVLSL